MLDTVEDKRRIQTREEDDSLNPQDVGSGQFDQGFEPDIEHRVGDRLVQNDRGRADAAVVGGRWRKPWRRTAQAREIFEGHCLRRCDRGPGHGVCGSGPMPQARQAPDLARKALAADRVYQPGAGIDAFQTSIECLQPGWRYQVRLAHHDQVSHRHLGHSLELRIKRGGAIGRIGHRHHTVHAGMAGQERVDQ